MTVSVDFFCIFCKVLKYLNWFSWFYNCTTMLSTLAPCLCHPFVQRFPNIAEVFLQWQCQICLQFLLFLVLNWYFALIGVEIAQICWQHSVVLPTWPHISNRWCILSSVIPLFQLKMWPKAVFLVWKPQIPKLTGSAVFKLNCGGASCCPLLLGPCERLNPALALRFEGRNSSGGLIVLSVSHMSRRFYLSVKRVYFWLLINNTELQLHQNITYSYLRHCNCHIRVFYARSGA